MILLSGHRGRCPDFDGLPSVRADRCAAVVKAPKQQQRVGETTRVFFRASVEKGLPGLRGFATWMSCSARKPPSCVGSRGVPLTPTTPAPQEQRPDNHERNRDDEHPIEVPPGHRRSVQHGKANEHYAPYPLPPP